MAKLKCHVPNMVNVAIYGMIFATGPELPQGLSFGVGEGGPYRGSGKNFALVIWLFYELGGGKCEMSYAYNGKCSSICDAICHRTGVAPGDVLWGRNRRTLEGMREKKLALVIWLFYELGVAKLKCHMPIMVNVAVYAMQFATGPEIHQELSIGLG